MSIFTPEFVKIRRVHQRIVRWVTASVLALIVVASCTQLPFQLVGAGAATAPAGTKHAAFPRPNIVFVLTDDLSENLVAQMPQVLSLERAGASFSHYDVVDSLCCPSRTAIFTGEYPHDDGVYSNGGPFGGYGAFQANHDAKHCFVRDLRKAGYTTAFMGKYLNGYKASNAVPAGWDVWDGVNKGGYAEYDYRVNTDGHAVQFGSSPSDYLTDVLSHKAGAFITSTAKTRRPFFLEVATFAPHRPFVPALRYRKTAHGALYPTTPAYDAQVRNAPPWLRHRPGLTKVEALRMRTKYQRRVEDDYSVDNLLGHIRARLKTAGVARNTYVVFSSDNGYHMGEYRLLSGKETAFDTDINVPLVVSGPHVPAGATVSQLASNIDLAPTFDALAHAHVDPKTDGVSLLPILFGHHPADWQRALLIEHRKPTDGPSDPDAQSQAEGDPPSYEAVRTLNGLFVRYVGGAEEYYNTKVDPYELDNLGGKKAPRPVKIALKRLVACHRALACQRAATRPFTHGG
jgi:N-acetylglucosamine-6-sulfatase